MLTSFLISPYNKFRSVVFWPSRKSLSNKIARATVKVDPGGMYVSPDSRLMVSCTDIHTLYTHIHTSTCRSFVNGNVLSNCV